MVKKEYLKPTMVVVKIQQQSQILAGSSYGMKTELSSDDEVEEQMSIWCRATSPLITIPL